MDRETRAFANFLQKKGRSFKRKGGGILTRCLFHNEQTPSLQWWPDHGWYCHGCGESGKGIRQLLQKVASEEARIKESEYRETQFATLLSSVDEIISDTENRF